MLYKKKDMWSIVIIICYYYIIKLLLNKIFEIPLQEIIPKLAKRKVREIYFRNIFQTKIKIKFSLCLIFMD